MSDISMLLPQPSPAVGAVTIYLLVGAALCAQAGVPVPERWARPHGDHFGQGPARWTVAVLAIVLTTLLWPAASLWRAWSAHRAPARRGTPEPTRDTMPVTWTASLAYNTTPATYSHVADVYGADDENPTALPAWVRDASAHIVRALAERRLLDAVLAARSLMWDVETAFGPSSQHLWNAMELLAHACHEIGDDRRAVQLYLRAATGWAHNFGAEDSRAHDAYRRATALWAHTADRDDPAAQLLLAAVASMLRTPRHP